MVRVGGTGISGIIDASGRVNHRIAYGATEVVSLPLPAALPVTPFGQNSRLSFWSICLCFLVVGFITGLVRKYQNYTLNV